MTLPDLGGGAIKGQTSVRLASSNFTVTAPDGFCVDETSVKDTVKTGFVLMADCAALRGKKHKVDQSRSVLLTTTVAAPLENPESVTPQALQKFFSTEQGRAVLSRNGDAVTVSASMEIVDDDTLILHIRDSSPVNIDGLSQDDWRAFTVIHNRLVTLSVTPFVGVTASNTSAKALVIQLARLLLAENVAQ
ncbi:hypothetical protein [Pacificibacter marinus]|uniref:hypothetical protein n=1 Tax=Pacificibacter marinus TaxID=658057 RepID=UPI001C07E7F8|nr:hypothetical protein [Pacificibacter marinus]MBU2866139.1 hypothetical protein [Pacificibacter marinus]